MSHYTDENGEQLYPTNLVIDTRPAEYHAKVQAECFFTATDEELKRDGWVKPSVDQMQEITAKT